MKIKSKLLFFVGLALLAGNFLIGKGSGRPSYFQAWLEDHLYLPFNTANYLADRLTAPVFFAAVALIVVSFFFPKPKSQE